MGRLAPLALTNEKEVQMSKRLFATAVIASSLVGGLGFSVPAIADAGNGKVVVSQKDGSITIGNNAISRTFDVKGGLKTGKIENKLGKTELTPAEGSGLLRRVPRSSISRASSALTALSPTTPLRALSPRLS